MADVTPVYGLPFQEVGDAPNGPALGEDLALAVEAEIARIDAAAVGVQWKHTTANISTNLTATYTNVTGFTFAAVAGKAYAIDCVMFVDNPAANAADMRFGWTWTGTGVMTAGQSGLDVNVTSPAYNGTETAHAIIGQATSPLDESTGLGLPLGIPVLARFFATYVCNASGTVQLRFRQDTASGTASRVLHGSRMRVERMN